MANINIGTLKCPGKDCSKELAVDSDQEIDWKHGVVNVSLQLTDEAADHVRKHGASGAGSKSTQSTAKYSPAKSK